MTILAEIHVDYKIKNGFKYMSEYFEYQKNANRTLKFALYARFYLKKYSIFIIFKLN